MPLHRSSNSALHDRGIRRQSHRVTQYSLRKRNFPAPQSRIMSPGLDSGLWYTFFTLFYINSNELCRSARCIRNALFYRYLLSSFATRLSIQPAHPVQSNRPQRRNSRYHVPPSGILHAHSPRCSCPHSLGLDRLRHSHPNLNQTTPNKQLPFSYSPPSDVLAGMEEQTICQGRLARIDCADHACI